MVEEMKELSRNHGKEYSDSEAREAAWNLTRYVELVWEIAKRETQKKSRLRKEPGGFPVDGNYSCLVCGNSINEQTGWYDWYGQTCLLCRKAIQDGVIPAFGLHTHSDSYFPMWRLTSDWKVRTPRVLKYIKEGKIKPRIILNEEGKPHMYIFLRKENPDLILKNDPVRKSYDRKRKKKDARWSREKAKEWKDELKAKEEKAGISMNEAILDIKQLSHY